MKVKALHVPEPIHEQIRSISLNNWVYGVEHLSSSDSAGHVVTTSDIESMQHLGLTGEFWIITEVVDNDQYLKEPLISSVIHDTGNLMMRIQDLVKGVRGIVIEVESDPRLYVEPSSLSLYTSSLATTSYQHRLKVRTHGCERSNLYRCPIPYSAIGLCVHDQMGPK